MAVINFLQVGQWEKTKKFLEKGLEKKINSTYIFMPIFEKYGEEGVKRLKDATPKKTGKTAESWTYKIINTEDETFRLIFENSNISNGVNIAILIDKGHLTKNGNYIPGYDFIDPVIDKIFDDIKHSIWKEIIER